MEVKLYAWLPLGVNGQLVLLFLLITENFQFRLATLLCATNASALRASTKPFKGSWDLSSWEHL